jgi:hypothetical protein
MRHVINVKTGEITTEPDAPITPLSADEIRAAFFALEI